MVPLDILMKNDYDPLLLFDMLKFKSLNRFIRKTHQILKKCFGIEEDTGKVNYSQLPMGWALPMTFTAKNVRAIESKSLLQLLNC